MVGQCAGNTSITEDPRLPRTDVDTMIIIMNIIILTGRLTDPHMDRLMDRPDRHTDRTTITEACAII